mmetsp:Transcript_29463/g.80963  ORF Transcript_29463/g.80963 Transcript_29463/m.80963 type:complete len:238 (+) Transcript_29463:98-811(+)
MGVVFGKQTVAEPAYEVISKQLSSSLVPYEIRRYSTRFAAETAYAATPSSATAENEDNTPFRLLAQYIGVFGTPANEGQHAISMTAPVMKKEAATGEPVKIAMTAPVIKEQPQDADEKKTMAFVLPAEYDSLAKIPKPTDGRVHIKEIPPQTGVVHRYSGSYSDDISREKALALAQQLREDGLVEMSDELVLQQYQFWGYNPPFTIPYFRRNEIWVELSQEQVNLLVNGVVDAKAAN